MSPPAIARRAFAVRAGVAAGATLGAARALLRVAGDAALWGIVAAGLGACAARATAADCDALLDRYVELLVREQNPRANEAQIAEQKGVTREKAARDPSFASCPKEVSARAARCAMGAPNVDELEKCLE